MSSPKNVQTSNIKNNILKSDQGSTMNLIMTISPNPHIQQSNQSATMSGFTMCARYGFLNATSKKKMQLSISKEFKISIKKDSNKDA